MILKGNQRGGGQRLADHLMNDFDNDRVEVMEVRGAIAQDLSGAFAEWSAQAKATKIEKKFYYSLSLNPDQAQGRLTREQYLDLIERTERSLNLVNQPRAVVFHEKRDDKGVPREHCHVVWSRVDTRQDRVKAVDISHDRLKLRTVAREFCRDHGLEMPEHMKPGRQSEKFNEQAKQDLGERQQKERSGISKQQRMADIATCWKETGNGAAFIAALEGKGYFIAQGDRRAFVVVDLHGEVHSLSRQLSGIAKSKDLKARLAGYPLDKLPTIGAAQEHARDLREERERQTQRQPTEMEKRIAALREHQHNRRADLDALRINLLARHMAEREGLRAAHDSEKNGVASARLQKQPKGIMAFLQRVTGIKMLVEAKQQREDKARDDAHKRQADTLARAHEREMGDMDRRYNAMHRLEVRENKSADTALKREAFQQLLEQCAQRALKPEFDRAAQGTAPPAGAGDGKEIDLREQFNREVANRLDREDRDRDNDGPDRGFDPRKR